jgi:hypothetical protein
MSAFFYFYPSVGIFTLPAFKFATSSMDGLFATFMPEIRGHAIIFLRLNPTIITPAFLQNEAFYAK